MKLFKTFCVFILALTLNSQAQANEQTVEAQGLPAATCAPDAGKNCADNTHAASPTHDAKPEHGDGGHASTSGGHGKKTAPRDWTHKRLEQVASILPEKTKAVGADARPAKVKLVSPKFLSTVGTVSVKLEWSEATDAKNYHVQVSKDAGFNNRSMYIAEDKWVKGTSFEIKDLEAGVKYFWRVAAVNPDQESQYTKSAFVSSAFETAAQ